MKRSVRGWGSGLIGVLLFSGSVPATRLAVGQFDPIFFTSARAVISGSCALALLLVMKQKRPGRADFKSLTVVILCIVFGFPLLTALALQHMSAAPSLVFVGLLPLITAAFGVIRCGERPRRAFWVFSALGCLTVAAFALSQGGAVPLSSGLLLVGSSFLCGLGYAEGSLLSRRIGEWHVILWALAAALPIMLLIACMFRPDTLGAITLSAWLALGYVSVFAMLIGFVFWYRGLALGGVAAVGQLQLLQPFFGLIVTALVLQEHIRWSIIVVSVIVLFCVAAAKRYA